MPACLQRWLYSISSVYVTTPEQYASEAFDHKAIDRTIIMRRVTARNMISLFLPWLHARAGVCGVHGIRHFRCFLHPVESILWCRRGLDPHKISVVDNEDVLCFISRTQVKCVQSNMASTKFTASWKSFSNFSYTFSCTIVHRYAAVQDQKAISM